MKFVCPICGYVYDEAKESVTFEQLPDSWVCPWCGAAKSVFAPEKARGGKEAGTKAKNEAESSPRAVKEDGWKKGENGKDAEELSGVMEIHNDMRKLSAGELSALCSNLARGCEKQYKDREAELFLQIADYFASQVPSIENADMGDLKALLQGDLKEGYPALHGAAKEEGDRGTQRICVWGEKVTNIQNSLLMRYEREGEAFLADTQIWVCSVCGFIYVGDIPPELCPVCKVPDWKFDKVEGRD